MPTTKDRVIVILSPMTLENLDARAPRIAGGLGRSTAAEEGLSRYYAIMAAARCDMEGAFTDAEILFLADITNGSFVDAMYLSGLAMEIADSAEEGETWGVDVKGLARRVGKLPLSHKCALVDLAECRRRERTRAA